MPKRNPVANVNKIPTRITTRAESEYKRISVARAVPLDFLYECTPPKCRSILVNAQNKCVSCGRERLEPCTKCGRVDSAIDFKLCCVCDFIESREFKLASSMQCFLYTKMTVQNVGFSLGDRESDEIHHDRLRHPKGRDNFIGGT
jgi:hypothetical protein